MKIFYIITLLFISVVTQAQIVDIPDANFKNALVNTNCVDIDGDWNGDIDADTNNDGEIQVTEAESVLRLRVHSQDISSLEGIQDFTNLEELFCFDNQLTSMNVTQNEYLQYLWCTSNQLTNLNVTQNQNLERLIFLENQLTSIDVTQNLQLEKLSFYGNQLLSLDVTQNPNLEELSCSSNQLTSLNVTQNPNLEKLTCWNNQISSLDLSQNPNLVDLSLGNNALISLDISQSPNLEKLWFSNNQLLINLNIKNGNNQNMTRLWVNDNPNLICIQVDDVVYANNQDCDNNNWCKDDWTEYSEECILGIEENSLISFTIYPNPTQDVLFIDTQQSIETIKIYNVQGQLVKGVSYNNVDVSQLTTGLYFIQVTLDGKTITKKFIKE